MTGIALARALRAFELAAYGGTFQSISREIAIARVVRPLDAEHESDLVVLTSPAWLEQARKAQGLVLTTAELGQELSAGPRWIHEFVPFTLARLLTDFGTPPNIDKDEFRSDAPRHAAISVHARIASDVVIEPGVVVFGGAQIGPKSRLGARAVIYGKVTLGCRVQVGAGSVIGAAGFGFATGPHGEVVRVPQLGGVSIGDDVEIGALSTIDAGTLSPTRLGPRVKLDAQVHVGHNVELGRDVMVAAQSGFGGSVEICEGVRVGGQVGVTDHVRVGAGARLAAQSGVIGDVPAGAVVAGYPARSKSEWLRGVAWLRRAAKRTKLG